MSLISETYKMGELVDVEALGAYAKEQWDLGDRAAEDAGEPYWYRGTDALEKAIPSVRALGEETVDDYCERVTGRKKTTIYYRRTAYKNAQKLLATSAGKKFNAPNGKIPNTVRGLTGNSQSGQSHMRREWTPEVDAQAKQAFREQISKTIETRAEEAAAERALAKRMIDIGYKVLAKELHPDAGGNREAMTRLSEVKRRAYRAFGLLTRSS